ncbi:MAG: hypothetical protein NDI69_09145 [Bacteriovoracaceae bacterium]|nr:hypothetical protein [Bacteriovoracaceae bacterium]
MLRAFLVVGLVGLVSCASSNKTGDPGTDAVIAHMSQGPKVMGKDWDEKFLKDGFINGDYIAIGSATSRDIDYFQKPLRVNAESEATARLLRSAPTDFKKIIQRSLNTLNGDEGSTQESQIMITEVKALTGMKSNFDDVQCVTRAEPRQDLKYNYVKECRVIVRVPALNLAKAYDYTLDKKYGIKQQNQLEDILQKELLGTSETRSVASKQ